MKKDLTKGKISKSIIVFAAPMIVGNLLQQFYNIADTLLVGKFIGSKAMAAVGTAYAFMSFLTSILIGLCMGSGSVFSFYFGKKDYEKMESCMKGSFLMIGGFTILVTVTAFLGLTWIIKLLQVPSEIAGMLHIYLKIILSGVIFVFLYNYFAYLLRSVGNSVVPLYFLGVSSIINVVLDVVLIVQIHLGIAGAAAATVFSQLLSGVGLGIYTRVKYPDLFRKKKNCRYSVRSSIKEVAVFSFAASIQQSVMNFGILVVQGIVNSFGVTVMAAFTAAVKIDSFAYMPAQEFGNAFSLFVSQNYGAGKKDRIRKGLKSAVCISMTFCILVSALVCMIPESFMKIFAAPHETELIAIGAGYLRVEGSFYFGIGILFLLYAYYRGIHRPEMSLILTILSLGTRILLGYFLSSVPAIGYTGIWWAVPAGWILADLTGIGVMLHKRTDPVDKKRK